MFEGLLGQEFIKRTLSEAVSSGKTGHAYLFCGPDGIGRKSFAKEFARGVMCTGAAAENAPCGVCRACRLAAAETNPDVQIIRGDENRATLGVEVVRQLEEDIATAPTVSARKVYIIDRGEKLTVQAQNALLKTIEEPPEYVMLVIVCSNPALLIDTVRSRVTRLDFARYSREEVLEAYRKTGGKTGEESEEFIVSYADGIIGRALQLKDFGLYGTLRERILDTLLVLKKSQGRFLTEFTELFTDKDSSANKDYMFFELTSFVRDAALFARLGDSSALQNTHFQNKIKELAAVTGRHGWEKILDAVNSAYRLAGQNVNYRMVTVNLAAAIIEAVRN